MHAVAEVQETAVRSSPLVGPPMRDGCTVHDVPFHCSASVFSSSVAEPSPHSPAAVQALADGHDTPWNGMAPPPGNGVVWMVHVWPFHRSARVPPFSPNPTAVHAV